MACSYILMAIFGMVKPTRRKIILFLYTIFHNFSNETQPLNWAYDRVRKKNHELIAHSPTSIERLEIVWQPTQHAFTISRNAIHPYKGIKGQIVIIFELIDKCDTSERWIMKYWMDFSLKKNRKKYATQNSVVPSSLPCTRGYTNFCSYSIRRIQKLFSSQSIESRQKRIDQKMSVRSTQKLIQSGDGFIRSLRWRWRRRKNNVNSNASLVHRKRPKMNIIP